MEVRGSGMEQVTEFISQVKSMGMILYSNMLCSCVGYLFVTLILGEFSFALPPPLPPISMLWRALFIHLRSLFCEKAGAAQNIKEENNIEIEGRGGAQRRTSQR